MRRLARRPARRRGFSCSSSEATDRISLTVAGFSSLAESKDPGEKGDGGRRVAGVASTRGVGEDFRGIETHGTETKWAKWGKKLVDSLYQQHLFVGVDFAEFYFNNLAAAGGDMLANISGFNGQLAMAAVDEDGELDA